MKYVLFHKNCNDGTGAAYAFWLKFPNYTYIPCEYSKDPPQMPDAEHVYIVDFSFKRNVLLDLAAKFPVTVLDHHKTAEADLQGLEFAHFDMGQSGAMLAWKFVHGVFPAPKLIRYIQDRDLWKKELPFTDEISAYMFQFERSFENFRKMHEALEQNFNDCISQGRAIQNYIDQQVNTLCSKARKGTLLGHEVLFVNTPILQSEVGNKLIAEGKGTIVASYADSSEGGIYISLRSRRDVDCSVIAESFGGGGHKNASGFYVKSSPTLAFLSGYQKT